ncbi:MAG: SNF2 helicase associated domain-containing protein [Cellulosilyticaceae bacterium]
MLTDEEIRYWSTNAAVYERGVDLYRCGAVPKLNVIQEGDLYTVRGYVEGSHGEMYYNLLEMRKGNVDDVYFECECPAAHKYEGACKHTVAMMLKLQAEMSRGSLAVHQVDVAYGKALLDYYEDSIMKGLEEKREAFVRVEPKLYETEEGYFALGLSVGEDRLYVVKHMEAFVQAILQEEQVAYGKNFVFIHHLEAFVPEARALIQLLIHQQKAKEQVLERVHGGRMYSMDKKMLPLTPDGFYRFFEIYKNRSIAFQDERGQMEVSLLEASPQFVFKIEAVEGQFVLTTSQKHYQIINHPLAQYLWVQDHMYLVSKAYAKAVLPVLKFMQEVYPPQLKFDEESFKRFAATILPKLKRYATVQVDYSVLQDYEPPELTIKLYLDRDQKDSVVGHAVFDYEGICINPFGGKEQAGIQVVRQIEKEHAFHTLLEKYQFRAKDGKLYVEDEEAIYTLLTEGVEELVALCEVHVTNPLRDMQIKAPGIGRIGLTIKSHLLEVDLKEMRMEPHLVQEILEAYRTKKKYYRLKDGAFVDLSDPWIEEIDELLEGISERGATLESRTLEVGKYRSLYLERLLKKGGVIQIEKDQAYKKMLRDMREIEDGEVSIPPTLSGTLRQYQEVGYRWLVMMAKYGFGGILADDMGLGKTLQVITLFQAYKNEHEKAEPSLVVSPTSLVLNWEKELARFAPGLVVQVMTGSGEEREAKASALEGVDVVITSYDTLKRDEKLYEDKRFKYCILDEAHYIKNPLTQNAKVVKGIKSDVRFALTGTPIENRLSELWSLFDFCMPGYLFSYHQFKATFETPIMRMEDDRTLKRLKEMIAPFVLRRLKKDVLKELPEKTETILYNGMEDEQEDLYKAHLALVQKELSKELENHGFSKSHMKILAMLTRLRQLCCHPGLYLEDYTGESSKLLQAMELIEESVAGGHKVLVFSQFTTMLDKLGEKLQSEGIPYHILTGSTKVEKRMAMVESFGEDEVPIFLISLKAGGTGLNLTAADVVIHYDPWWNVSSEQQATDRVYRIGQNKPVQVFKLITKDSIEEKIMALQQQKRELAQSIVSEGATFLSHLSEHELRGLFE